MELRNVINVPGDAGRRLAQPTLIPRPAMVTAQVPCCHCRKMREIDDRHCVHCGAIQCEG